MEPFLGQIQLFAMSYAPNGWLPCDGRTSPIAQFQALFSLLGTNYGGNGMTTFNLQNIPAASARPNAPGGGIWCMAIAGVYPPRY